MTPSPTDRPDGAPTARPAGAPSGRPRRSLVTGGAGFIGSHLVTALLARGDEVTVVDDLSTGRRGNLAQADPAGRAELIEGDLRASLPGLAGGPVFDEVYHLAAAVGVGLVMRDPVGSIETNIEQTAALLRFTRPGPGRPAPAVLVASSSEVYGKPPHEEFDEEDDAVYGPTSVTRWSYACTKAIDEHLAIAHARHHGVPAVVARFFNTVGPRQVGEHGMVLPRFVEAALDGRPLEVHGDGTQSRCFCDVRDVAAALPRLTATPGLAGRAFNLGSDRPITIRTLAETVIRVVGSRSEIREVPYSAAYPVGFEDLMRRRPSLRRVRAAIGFEPAIGLEQTIRDLADDIRARRAEDGPGATTARPERGPAHAGRAGTPRR